MEKDLNIKDIKLKDYKIPPLNCSDEQINSFLKDINRDIESKNFMNYLDLDNYLKFTDIFKKNNTVIENNIEIINEIYSKLFSSFKHSINSLFDLKKYNQSI